ncbi:MAG: T9SS type A sorting domain-containing protein [Candidatus Tenebribacter davisii]|nr:T9SS type A sorting domain-containing protein [Candidatus Tenebribacter davisii]
MKNFIILVSLILALNLSATIINVPADQLTIQAGINSSVDADTVLVQPGTYYENVNFAGRLITVGSLFLTTLDTTYISSTIIDGNNSGIVVAFETSEDNSALLSGFTITNGYTAHGGGIRCSYASPSLENLIITNNSVLNYGGGIYCGYADPIIKNVVIANNHAVMWGGGIATWYSDPVLTNVTISGNTAEDLGDGIYCSWNSSFSFTNSIVWNNSLDDIYIVSGGVVAATYSDIPEITGEGNIYIDPLFIDSGSGDYHLQSVSPCIDAGDPASPFDPDSTIADMGCFYFDQLVGINNYQYSIIDFQLSNHPNPFNPSTTISFSFKEASTINLSVYNIKGQKIRTLIHNESIQGSHSLVWYGDNDLGKAVSSGIYYYKLNVNGKTEAVRKCLLLK